MTARPDAPELSEAVCPRCESPFHGPPCPRVCAHGGPAATCVDPDAPEPWGLKTQTCACGGPCDHDESLACALRFQRAFDAETAVPDVVDKTGASDADFRWMLTNIEATPDAPESLRERVAAAIADADYEQATAGLLSWLDLDEAERDNYRKMADAALAVVRGETS